jgi:hypothetical protein
MKPGLDGRYHYLYITTHIVTGQIYIGIRTTTVHPYEDTYIGSGSRIKDIDNSLLHKTVLSTFETRNYALMAEMMLVNEEFCLREDTLNCRLGGERGKLIDNGRVMQGIAAAKLAGKFNGRPATVDTQAIKEALDNGNSIMKTAALCGVSKSTVQRVKKEMKQEVINSITS